MTEADGYEAEYRRRVQRALGEGYTLGERLGRGGFALVYAATDERLKRRVAVKILRAELLEVAGARERFRREAEAVAGMRHPHIIPIYAVGDAEGLAYFIMPLVEGGSLAEQLARQPRLDSAEARRILREAARGLAAAHRAGIIHRDIKPDNILLDGPERRVVLTDFGIAKALGGDTRGLTQTGTVIGTPHYMSPEQASGERAIDHRADLYSLGVVGYQMLAGQVPFNAQTIAAVLIQQITEGPPSVTRARPDCPPDLAHAVMRCLAKTPEERWASAEELERALAAADVDAPTRAVRRSSGVRALAALGPLRRFRLLTGVCLGGILALVLVDLVTHRVLLGPPGALVAAFLVAAEYGRLWTAGFTWRDVLARQNPALAAVASPQPLDSAELGPHRGTIQQARNDRAAMLALVQGLPGVERKQLGDLLPAIDALVARAAADARRLYALERQLEPGPEEIARRLADTRGEAPSPGREQRIAVLERRLQAMGDIAARRERLAVELTARLGAVSRARFELDRAIATGLGDGLPAVVAAREEARALALTTGAGG
jgi:tRNA A-37 threonylcarbamoyl transferase component Bud32